MTYINSFFLFLFSFSCFQHHLSAVSGDTLLKSPNTSNKTDYTKCTVKLGSVERAGMFFHMMTVLGALSVYDKGSIGGLSISYGIKGKFGAYHDPSIGPNWWEYYFEPVKLGLQNGIELITFNYIKGNPLSPMGMKMSRVKAGALLKKYVVAKEHIQKIINQMVEREFGESYLIGVHFRGTDKYTEAPRVPFENMLASIQQEIAKLETENYKIFIATDEVAFLEYIQEYFPNQIIYYKNAIRSVDGSPVHLNQSMAYKAGEDALVDCLLLSRCHCLVRTDSRLSQVAAYFNPSMPVVIVNPR